MRTINEMLKPHDEPEGNGKKRHTAVELEEMRADMVSELEAKGVSVEEMEKAVNEYSTKWKPAHIEKIRGEILPVQTARGSEEELTLQLPILSSDTGQFQSAATSWFVAEANDDYGERHILATGSFTIAPGVFA